MPRRPGAHAPHDARWPALHAQSLAQRLPSIVALLSISMIVGQLALEFAGATPPQESWRLWRKGRSRRMGASGCPRHVRNTPVQTQKLILVIGAWQKIRVCTGMKALADIGLPFIRNGFSAHPEYRQVLPSARAARHGHELMVKPTQQWSGSSLR